MTGGFLRPVRALLAADPDVRVHKLASALRGAPLHRLKASPEMLRMFRRLLTEAQQKLQKP